MTSELVITLTQNQIINPQLALKTKPNLYRERIDTKQRVLKVLDEIYTSKNAALFGKKI